MMEETYRKDFPVSWDEMHRDAKALAWRLQDKGPWKGIIAVTRGGMVPACIVAREIDVLMIQTLCITSYDYKNQSEAKLLHKPSIEDDGKGWLVIDDLADTGKTFKLAREIFPNAHFACIYLKPAATGTVDTFVTEVSQDTWIDFPWECDALTGTPQGK